MLFNTIGRRVARAIKARVKAAQEEHNQYCREQDDACREAKAQAERTRDDNKEAKAVQLVEKIIGR